MSYCYDLCLMNAWLMSTCLYRRTKEVMNESSYNLFYPVKIHIQHCIAIIIQIYMLYNDYYSFTVLLK